MGHDDAALDDNGGLEGNEGRDGELCIGQPGCGVSASVRLECRIGDAHRRCRAGKRRDAGGSPDSVGPEPTHRGASEIQRLILLRVEDTRRACKENPRIRRLPAEFDEHIDDKKSAWHRGKSRAFPCDVGPHVVTYAKAPISQCPALVQTSLHGDPQSPVEWSLRPTMRTTILFNLSRQCFRGTLRRSNTQLRPFRHLGSTFARSSQWSRSYAHPVKSRKRIVFLSLLTPAAFVQLSEDDIDDGKTAEEHMLAASREEISKKVPDNVHGLRRVADYTIYFLDQWVYEPIATGFRFLHLFVIFMPVIISVPMVWVGRRQKDMHDERLGTLWWFRFLVNAMERAGPAFIKVFSVSRFLARPVLTHSTTARTMGCVKNGYLSLGDVQYNVLSSLKCPGTFTERD